MANAKIKGENVKEVTFEVKDLNLDERVKFNNLVTSKGSVAKLGFGDFVEMVRIATTMTDDEINKFTDTEIITIANKTYEVVNKKINEIDLILNVWFAIKQPITKYKRSFPYKALNPLTNKKVVIENKEQAYGVLMDCYDDAKEKGYEIGEALYSQLFFLQILSYF